MERRAAVEYLLKIAEKTDNTKFSTIVNDLARRVALSIEQDEINLDKFCSKMAAELMFRDDYTNAGKLMKMAEDANTPPEDVLPVTNLDEEQQAEEPARDETTDFIEKNLPAPNEDSELPPLDTNKLKEFLARLQGTGVTINQDDSESNQPQMEGSQNQENQN